MRATESDETQGLTTEPKPLYGCQYGEDCAPHVSYPADMLAVWNGQAVCESCFENDPVAACQDNLEDELMWSDLPRFVPAHERRIELLAAIEASAAIAIATNKKWVASGDPVAVKSDNMTDEEAEFWCCVLDLRDALEAASNALAEDDKAGEGG